MNLVILVRIVHFDWQELQSGSSVQGGEAVSFAAGSHVEHDLDGACLYSSCSNPKALQNIVFREAKPVGDQGLCVDFTLLQQAQTHGELHIALHVFASAVLHELTVPDC